MKELISGYLWGYKNWEVADHSLQKFREFYPDGEIYIKVDKNGDFQNYTNIAKKYNADCSINPFQIGYPGNFTSSNHNVGRDGWPKENAFEWLNGIYSACLKTSAKYMIILEEDVFVLKPITIINNEFGAAIVRTNNIMPSSIMNFIKSIGGNTDANKYGCCGGCIINVKDFIRGYEFCKEELWDEYDKIFNHTKLIGWSDCVLQVIIQCAGSRVIVNEQLVEPWMQFEGWINDDWRNYEIINYLKDIEIIKSL